MKTVYEMVVGLANCPVRDFSILQKCEIVKGNVGDSAVIRAYRATNLILTGEYDWVAGNILLCDVENRLEAEGFTVKAYEVDGMRANMGGRPTDYFALQVTLVRAEEKLSPKVGCGFDATKYDANADFYGIIAAGPLVREEGMEPRRVVLRVNVTKAKYAVHTQGVPDGLGKRGEPNFSNGKFTNDRAVAMETFAQRIMRLERQVFPDVYGEE